MVRAYLAFPQFNCQKSAQKVRLRIYNARCAHWPTLNSGRNKLTYVHLHALTTNERVRTPCASSACNFFFVGKHGNRTEILRCKHVVTLTTYATYDTRNRLPHRPCRRVRTTYSHIAQPWVSCTSSLLLPRPTLSVQKNAVKKTHGQKRRTTCCDRSLNGTHYAWPKYIDRTQVHRLKIKTYVSVARILNFSSRLLEQRTRV